MDTIISKSKTKSSKHKHSFYYYTPHDLLNLTTNYNDTNPKKPKHGTHKISFIPFHWYTSNVLCLLFTGVLQ